MEYTVEEGGTQRGGRRLTDTLGFSYSVKRVFKGTTYWGCSVRNKKQRCNASVIEKEGGFHPGVNATHNHPPRVGITLSTALVAQVNINNT